MATSAKITPFSLNDLYVKLPADASWVQVPGINQAMYKGSVTAVEYYGDDKRLGIFFHTQKGTITAKASITSLPVIEKISGNSASSGTTSYSAVVGSGTATQNILLQTQGELTPPVVCVRASMRGRHPDGTIGWVVVTWFNTLCQTAYESFPSADYGKVDEISLMFEAFQSNVDENNSAIPVAAFGRIEIS
jgi:hypothetical protein